MRRTAAERIKLARLSAGLTQQKLADAISNLGDGETIARTSISQWETGETKEISAANLFKAAKVLGVSMEWILYGK